MLLLNSSGCSYFWTEHLRNVSWTLVPLVQVEHWHKNTVLPLHVSPCGINAFHKCLQCIVAHKRILHWILEYNILLISKTENLNGCYTLTLFVRLGDTQVPIQQQSSTHKNKWPANSTLIFVIGYCVYYVNTNLEIKQINHEHIRSICLTH